MSSLLLVTEVAVDPANAEKAAAVWQAQSAGAAGPSGVLYRGIEASTLLELTTLDALSDLEATEDRRRGLETALTPLLAGDFRRQVLRFVEAPKPVVGGLPDTPYVQLRHVEVKPPFMEEYLTWRQGTIFDVVRTTPQVEAFLAYHSLYSTEPGVMFVSGFSCAPEEYLPAFSSPRYGEIARHAHARYITEDGLYTRLYHRVGAVGGA